MNDALNEFILNFSTELLGIILTVLFIDYILKQRKLKPLAQKIYRKIDHHCRSLSISLDIRYLPDQDDLQKTVNEAEYHIQQLNSTLAMAQDVISTDLISEVFEFTSWASHHLRLLKDYVRYQYTGDDHGNIWEDTIISSSKIGRILKLLNDEDYDQYREEIIKMMNERIDVIAEDLREMGLSKSFTDDIDLVWKIHKNASPSQFEQKMSEEKASEETISKWLAYEYGPPYTKMYIMLPDKIPEITGFEIPDRIKQKLKPNILYCVEYDGLKKQWYIDGSKI